MPFEPSVLDIMLFCSILVSSDIVAAMSILKFDECPHIFSIILGEGLFNDVVVFTLYQVVDEYQSGVKHVEDFSAEVGLMILWNFITLCILSVLIGVLSGFLLTFLLKKFRFVSHSAIHETFLLITWAFITFFMSELLGQSEITSLVSCAIVYGHYTWYNLSPQGKHVTSITF